MNCNKPTRLKYCQYLLSSQINYTLTYFADHTPDMSHDAVNRQLKKDHVTGSDIWRNVRHSLVPSANAYVVFDDTVMDKDFSHKIELVRRQWQRPWPGQGDRCGQLRVCQSRYRSVLGD